MAVGDRALQNTTSGGGNTSVKVERLNLFGEKERVLHVKGSGWDLDTIEAAGLPGVLLDPLFKLRELNFLSDEDMVNIQRSNLLDSSSPNNNLNLCQDLEEAAEYIGEISLECQKVGSEAPLQESPQLGSSFILGGQIKNQSPNIILIYPEGNHIHVSDDSPFVQIGETKYGKPILDRTIAADTPLGLSLIHISEPTRPY